MIHDDTTALIIRASISDMFWTLNDHLHERRIVNSQRYLNV